MENLAYGKRFVRSMPVGGLPSFLSAQHLTNLDVLMLPVFSTEARGPFIDHGKIETTIKVMNE